MFGFAAEQEFYPDLADERVLTPFAIFHQRYATNTAPTWHRAQPARTLAHNGEINTVWGNRARMAARRCDAAGGVQAGADEGWDGFDESG